MITGPARESPWQDDTASVQARTLGYLGSAGCAPSRLSTRELMLSTWYQSDQPWRIATRAAMSRTAVPWCWRRASPNRVCSLPGVCAVSRADRVAVGDAAQEIESLAALLAEVVLLAEDRAVFPGRWVHIAELAREHQVVRCALLTAGSKS